MEGVKQVHAIVGTEDGIGQKDVIAGQERWEAQLVVFHRFDARPKVQVKFQVMPVWNIALLVIRHVKTWQTLQEVDVP